MNTSKKDSYIAIGAIIIIAAAVWGIYAYQKKQNNAPEATQPENSVSPSATSTPPAAATGSKTLSYGDAIKKYPNRFQFSQCQGTPPLIAVKKGTVVMLDNRDSTAHTIKADKQSFYIAGYHYALLYTSVVGNLPVSCDGNVRVTLNVEK